MRDGDDFRVVVRRGAKAASSTVVVHVVPGTDGGTTSVGFVVSKAVGDAVTRNRVKRRLRHLMRERLTVAPPGSRIVVRALPGAADASGTRLAADLDRALHRAARVPDPA